MLFITLQWWNSGRIQVFDFDAFVWTYSSPPHPRLPSAVTTVEAFEMLRWFAPVFTVLLISRHAFPVLATSRFYLLVCLNAAANAVLALTHHFQGWEMMYKTVRDSGKDTYGSFGYPNHAATFFILLFAFALGLTFREIFKDRSERQLVRMAPAALVTVLFFFTAQFSASRAGMLGVWLVLLLTLISIAIIAWPRIHPVQRLYASLGALLLLVVLVAGFFMFADPAHLRELRRATTDLDPSREFNARFFQIESAIAMWKDHPWFGVGGWGYRYFVGFYIDESMWTFLGVGKANVHNDFFQFLAEFGLVGITLLGIAFGPAIARAVRDTFRPPEHPQSLWAFPLRISLAFGLLLMLAHSMIDLPFRSPAVFIHGTLFLVLISCPHAAPPVWLPKVDWNNLVPPVRYRPPGESSRRRSENP